MKLTKEDFIQRLLADLKAKKLKRKEAETHEYLGYQRDCKTRHLHKKHRSYR